MHQRQAIREAVTARLKGRTAAGGRVYETQKVPWTRLELPAIAVYSLDETVDPASKSTAPRELTRTVPIAIEAVVRPGANVDDAMDAMSLEIERVVDRDPTFGDTASDSILATTEQRLSEEGDQTVGNVRLTYNVTYYTQAPDPADVELDDLKTVDVRTSLGGAVAAADQAEDTVTNLDEG
jgi:hypothetical protein